MDEKLLLVLVILTAVAVAVAVVIWKRKETFYVLTTNRFIDDSIQDGLPIRSEKELRRAIIGRMRY